MPLGRRRGGLGLSKSSKRGKDRAAEEKKALLTAGHAIASEDKPAKIDEQFENKEVLQALFV